MTQEEEQRIVIEVKSFRGDLVTTGALAKRQQERYETDVSLFQSAVMTNIGILHEPIKNPGLSQ